MGKAFEKQTKIIEDHRKKQVEALNTLKPKKLQDQSDDNEKHLEYKKVFDELSNEIIVEIYNISKEIDFSNLTYYFKSPNIAPINFIGFRGPLNIYNKIENDNISIKKIEKHQKQFKSKLNEVTTGNPRHKSKYQLDTIKNVENL